MKRVYIRRARLYGVADSSGGITIDDRQHGKEELDTIIHELLHVFDWRWSDKEVSACAGFITGALWSCKYRKQAKKKRKSRK